MPIEITVPRLGWTMEEGTFVGWLKNDGEHVRAAVVPSVETIAQAIRDLCDE